MSSVVGQQWERSSDGRWEEFFTSGVFNYPPDSSSMKRRYLTRVWKEGHIGGFFFPFAFWVTPSDSQADMGCRGLSSGRPRARRILYPCTITSALCRSSLTIRHSWWKESIDEGRSQEIGVIEELQIVFCIMGVDGGNSSLEPDSGGFHIHASL